MKALLIEVRLLMAEKLLGWAMEIVPAETDHGATMIVAIKRYFEYAVKKQCTDNGE